MRAGIVNFPVTVLHDLQHPIVQAPMAGGPSTPELAAAVSNAGALGFLAAGYLTPDAFAAQLAAVRRLTSSPFGVNVFVAASEPGDAAAVEAFTKRLAPVAAANGVELGEPRFDDDAYAAKLEIIVDARPAVVSFAFGCPSPETIDALRSAAIEVWITVTDVAEARIAHAAGADGVVAQGAEAGGHRSSFVDDDRPHPPLAQLLAGIRTEFAASANAPAVVGAGAVMTGADAQAALGAGAAAVQMGTAFLLCPEAGTNAAYRRALQEDRETIVTRAFTGRQARGLVNVWTDQFDADAPSAYPEIHHVTAPLRAHGRAVGDADLFNLWAGTGHRRARELPAAELVSTIGRELRA